MATVREPIHKFVRANGSVRYRARLDVGKTSDGRRIQKHATFTTRRDAREWLASMVDERAKGTLVSPSRITVNDMLDDWMDGKRDLRPSTRRTYRDALKPVRAALGARPVQRLTKADLDALVRQMTEGGGQHGRARGARTVTITLNVLQQALTDAAQQGLVVRNVASLVQRPRQAHLEMTTWTLAEVRQFEQAAADERLQIAWLLTLLGLRRGEVLGLRWQDVDLDPSRPALRIRQTRVPVHGHGVVISEPKTTRGRRTLPLDPYLVAAFREFRDRRDREAAMLGQVVDLADIVVTDGLGTPVPPEKYSKMFRQLSKSAGLRTIRLHDVRHTALTLMALNGVPLAVVAAWAGHADPAFTLRVYAHSQDDAIRSASSLLTKMISE